VWKATMERHFRDTAWLRVRKERYDRLVAYKSQRALATWEDVIDELLERA
jgi:predicted alpha-1,6-mannanase (GH76 family)